MRSLSLLLIAVGIALLLCSPCLILAAVYAQQWLLVIVASILFIGSIASIILGRKWLRLAPPDEPTSSPPAGILVAPKVDHLFDKLNRLQLENLNWLGWSLLALSFLASGATFFISMSVIKMLAVQNDRIVRLFVVMGMLLTLSVLPITFFGGKRILQYLQLSIYRDRGNRRDK